MDASLDERLVQTAAETRFCVILSLACWYYLQVIVHVGKEERGGVEEKKKKRLSWSELGEQAVVY